MELYKWLIQWAYSLVQICDSNQIINNMLGELFAGVLLAVIIYLLSDYIFKYPDLCGKWNFRIKIHETAYLPYDNSELLFMVLMQNTGSMIFGTGEKIWDKIFVNEDKAKETEYIGKDRIRIKISGSIERRVLSKNRVIIHYEEEGKLRFSSTIHLLKLDLNKRKMSGVFYSTIANTAGICEWEKIATKKV
jgi:hypothetical protein